MELEFAKIRQKIQAQKRISREDALYLWERAPDELLKDLATISKSQRHDPLKATYLIMAIVNYTNICVAKCDYCSFYRLPDAPDTYLHDFSTIAAKIDALLEWGGTMVGFNGGFHPGLKIHDYAELFSKVRKRYGNRLQFYGMTVAEFIFAAKVSRLDLGEAAQVLKKAGTEWVTGGGAEILDNSFRRRHSPGKFTVSQYLAGQRALVKNGIGSTATMVIGFDETITERLNHLESLRDFQDSLDTPLASFLCWTYKPYSNQLGGQEISTKEYLRWLAICRIFLDNFEIIRTSVLTKNEEALLGLLYGADDFDLPTEDEVTQKAGATISLEFDAILQKGRELGLKIQHRPPLSLPSPKFHLSSLSKIDEERTV